MFKKTLVLFLFCLATAYFFERWLSLQNNTLAAQTSWYSYKQLSNSYFPGFMGADDFLYERPTLAGEKLNLATWFGHQDVLYHEQIPKDFVSYTVNFDLETPHSYLWIYLNCSDEECWAYRISADANYPAGLYLIRNSGEYVKTVAGATSALTPGSHRLQITREASGIYRIFIDEKIQNQLEYTYDYRPVRLLSGLNPASVTSVFWTDSQNHLKVLGFRGPFKIFHAVGFALLLFLLTLLFLKVCKADPERWNKVFLVQLVLTVLSLLLFGFDRFYWSHRYLSTRPQPNPAEQSQVAIAVENLRKKIFADEKTSGHYEDFLKKGIWYADFQRMNSYMKPHSSAILPFDFQVIQPGHPTEFVKELDPKFNQRPYLRIAFIGGSQTWGTGASNVNNTWVSQIVKDLAAKSSRKTVGVNFSVCGAVLYNYLDRLDQVIAFKPDLLIVNFGANDLPTDEKEFRAQLNTLIAKLKDGQIQTLFSIEATSFESGEGETRKAALIREITGETHQELVNLHDYFAAPETRDLGHIWHDHLHFKDYGQALAARFFIKTSAYRKLSGN